MRNSPNPDPRARARSELRTVLASCRHAFLGIGLMSGMINVLYLTGSFFMLEIYDRVLPSRSVPTLVGLAVIAFVLYAFQGVLDVLRGRVLVRIGASLDEALSGRVFDILVRLPLKARTGRRRSAADARSRPGTQLPVEPRADGVVRPALDAALPRDLLPLPLLDRRRLR